MRVKVNGNPEPRGKWSTVCDWLVVIGFGVFIILFAVGSFFLSTYRWG